jgi:IS5 family transposase
LALVAPYYSKGEMGRKPVGLEIMLRVYFLQQWFALSDPGMEDALYESPVLRRFAGIDLGRAPVPDETTILNFRHLLEAHELCGQMLDAVNQYLAGKGNRLLLSARDEMGFVTLSRQVWRNPVAAHHPEFFLTIPTGSTMRDHLHHRPGSVHCSGQLHHSL